MSNSDSIDDYLVKHFGTSIFNLANKIYSQTCDGVKMLCKNCDKTNEYRNLLNLEPSTLLKYINCQQIGSFYCYYDPTINLSTQQTIQLNITNECSISRFEEEIVKECSLFDLVVDDCGFPSSAYFFPINFSCHTMINYLKNVQVDYLRDPKTSHPKNSFDAYYLLTTNVLLNTVNSVLLCIEHNNFDLGSAYSLLRTLMETYVTFNAISKALPINKDIIKDYDAFTKIVLSDSISNKEKGKCLNQRFDTNKFNDCRNTCEWLKIPKSGFTNIGNCDFKNAVKNTTLNQEEQKLISQEYSLCNHFVHGTLLTYSATRKDMYRILYISGMILEFIARDIQKEYGKNLVDFKHNNIDLFRYLKSSKDECLKRIDEQIDEQSFDISSLG